VSQKFNSGIVQILCLSLSGSIRLTIKWIVEKFTIVGNVCDQHKGHSGQKQTGVKNVEIVEHPLLKVQENF